METFEFDILRGESKTKQVLTQLNRINDAKHGSLLSNELASTIIAIGEIYAKQLESNKAKSSSDEFENFIPDFDYETKYYTHQNLPQALEIVKETNAAARLSYEERYKEENSFAKAA